MMQILYPYRRFFILASILLTLTGHAQQNPESIPVSIEWQPAQMTIPGQSLLMFEGAVNHDSLGLLPVFRYIIPNSSGGAKYTAYLADEQYEPLQIQDPDNFPDLELIGKAPKIIITTFESRKSAKTAICILPLRKLPDGGKYEKLVSFTVHYSLIDKENSSDGRASTKVDYAEHSVLQTGDWYKIAVKKTGVYKLSYQDLSDMGIDPAQTDPRNIRLFGNGNGMLPEPNSMERKDDLQENAIYVNGEEDGRFDPQDYILFYGQDPVKISYNNFYGYFEHEINYYSDVTCYFLTTGEIRGKRIDQGEAVSDEPTHEVNTFQELAYYEKEAVNLIKSGKLWYGEIFSNPVEYTFSFDLTDLDNAEPVYLRTSLAGRATTRTYFNLYANSEHIEEIEVPSVVLTSQIYARPLTSGYDMFYCIDDKADIRIAFEKADGIDVGWLNYIELNYIRHLSFRGGQLSFRDMRTLGTGNVARYHLQGATSNSIRIWDVSDPSTASAVVVAGEQGGVFIKAPCDIEREFIAFDNTQFYTPEFVEKVENQDLHGLQPADYIIVSNPIFLEQARRLADFHRQYSNLSVQIVVPGQIYNEFSSGIQDVSAIRDFMKMLYLKAGPGEEPRYLLLFGDASYDYKGYLPEDNNLVPAYESRESLKAAASFVTDDYYGCLDEDEGSNGSGTMDVGIGRFPVHTVEEAEAMVTKSINYMMPDRANFGPWRNSICFIGDDEDNNTHFGQAEGLVEITDSLGPVYNVNKIYLDAYSQLKTPSGNRYPDVNKAIDAVVNEGSLIINYTGHGGETAWADERILDIPAIQSYRNIHNLPAFVTATCEFSRYDDPGLVSAGELVFLNPDGAGIGLFTTTRLAFSQSNYALNKRFYYDAFTIDSFTGEYPRQGDLIRAAKTPSNQNIKNFVLLGDPALMLAYPRMKARTLNVVNEQDERPADTIHALSRVTIEGQVEDPAGNRLTGFNGTLYVTVFDKPVLYYTRGNDPTSKIADFYIQDKKIYKGESTITEGRFIFTFIVPQDISYQFGEGKISYYAVDTVNLMDAQGYDPIIIGGDDELATEDTQGPDIGLYLNTPSFKSGDVTTASPLLIADLFDESGINTVGNGIGHDISLILDGNYREPVILNDYYNPEADSYQRGQVIYGLGPISVGEHTLTLKAWDVLNNSSEETINFVVDPYARLLLTNAGTMPNPYHENVSFYFEHNKPGSTLDVTVRIFSLTGLQLQTLHYTIQPESVESGPMAWDGKDASGNELVAGFYISTMVVKSDDGYVSSISQKFLHFR